jgi:hypothetical protein
MTTTTLGIMTLEEAADIYKGKRADQEWRVVSHHALPNVGGCGFAPGNTVPDDYLNNCSIRIELVARGYIKLFPREAA